jgi:hypothetical protein
MMSLLMNFWVHRNILLKSLELIYILNTVFCALSLHLKPIHLKNLINSSATMESETTVSNEEVTNNVNNTSSRKLLNALNVTLYFCK